MTDPLEALAARWGVETAYFDVHGNRHIADDDVVRAVIDALAASGSEPRQFPQTPVRQAYQGSGGRTWLLAVQLYALRSNGNWGHGDFSDLASLLELVAALGGGGVGLNPLHALFYDRPGTGSPYSPSSRVFLNPLYIDVEAIEEFNAIQVAPLAERIDELRQAELIDYLAVADVKLEALRIVHRAFLSHASPARHEDFAAYRRERGPALDYFAAFETLRGLFESEWARWPQEWRTPNEELLRRLRALHSDELDFHAFLQWNADRQLARCTRIAADRGMPVGLYLDVAVGMDPYGAEAWMNQQAVLTGLRVGAPPDEFNPAGQDWGLLAYDPHAMIASNCEPFRQMLRGSMQFSGAIRIDHVLGLMRVFVIPEGVSTKEGVFLRFPLGAMLTAVAEESERERCLVIGEDLGTVPENFRATIAAWGIWSYLVMLFERNSDGSFRSPADYPERAIATFSTQDLPTFAGWMSGHDLVTKRGIGVDPGETDDQRAQSRTALQAALGTALPSFETTIAYLAGAPTRLLAVSIEDVLEQFDQVNVPGTIDQHPNWRRRWPLTIEALSSDPRLRRIADAMARAGRGPRGS